MTDPLSVLAAELSMAAAVAFANNEPSPSRQVADDGGNLESPRLRLAPARPRNTSQGPPEGAWDGMAPDLAPLHEQNSARCKEHYSWPRHHRSHDNYVGQGANRKDRESPGRSAGAQANGLGDTAPIAPTKLPACRWRHVARRSLKQRSRRARSEAGNLATHCYGAVASPAARGRLRTAPAVLITPRAAPLDRKTPSSVRREGHRACRRSTGPAPGLLGKAEERTRSVDRLARRPGR